MTFVDILLWILIIGFGLLLVSLGYILMFLLYGWIETKLIKKKIPEELKKEVEDARQQKGRIAGTGNPEFERATEQIRNRGINQQPEDFQSLPDAGDSEAERWDEPVDRLSKLKLRRI